VTNLEVVNAYFDAIRRKDADALGALFASDAELVTMAGRFVGPAEIARFYRELAFAVEDLWPEPGPLVVDDNRVGVEIRLRMNGKISLVGDFFTLAGDKIARLAIYGGPPGE